MMPGGPTDWDALPDSLTIIQAAAILGISRDIAYRGAAEGQIPALRVCGRWIVPKAALRRFLGIDSSLKPEPLPIPAPEPPRRIRRPAAGSHLRLSPGGQGHQTRKSPRRSA